MDNNAVIEAGLKKLETVAYEHFVSILRGFCQDLFLSADREKQYMNLTGNTFTSYACGIYRDGSLVEVLLSSDYKRPPVRLKLTAGEMWLPEIDGADYDGRLRPFRADVATDRGVGEATSMTFLRSYVPATKRGYEVVMCTGTEYSTFLEQVRHLNVLTNTFMEAPGLFFMNLKPIG
jgi:hypothetical protein